MIDTEVGRVKAIQLYINRMMVVKWLPSERKKEDR